MSDAPKKPTAAEIRARLAETAWLLEENILIIKTLLHYGLLWLLWDILSRGVVYTITSNIKTLEHPWHDLSLALVFLEFFLETITVFQYFYY